MFGSELEGGGGGTGNDLSEGQGRCTLGKGNCVPTQDREYC